VDELTFFIYKITFFAVGAVVIFIVVVIAVVVVVVVVVIVVVVVVTCENYFHQVINSIKQSLCSY